MTKCPKCKVSLNLSKAVKEWDKEFGDEWAEQAMINVACEKCEYEAGVIVDLSFYCKTETIHSPATGDNVIVPIINK